MNKNTISAFIELNGQDEEMLQSKLKSFGYKLQYIPTNPSVRKYLMFNNNFKTFSYVVWIPDASRPEKKDRINCNFYSNQDDYLASKLFLELAKMHDEWMICEKDVIFSEKIFFKKGDIVERERICDYFISYFNVATHFELAEAVMNSKIKLN